MTMTHGYGSDILGPLSAPCLPVKVLVPLLQPTAPRVDLVGVHVGVVEDAGGKLVGVGGFRSRSGHG